MANVKELKKKIKSTKSTLKITTAMKLVSAAKLTKYQQSLLNIRPFALELERLIKQVAVVAHDYSHPYLEEHNANTIALLVISSNRGLCGNFNSSIIKECKRYLRTVDRPVEVFFLGRKAREVLRKEVVERKFFEFAHAVPNIHEVRDIAAEFGSSFKAKKYQKVMVIYNKFRSAISFNTTVRQLLPMRLDFLEKQTFIQQLGADYLYEPGTAEIMDALIPEVLSSIVNKVVLESIVAEHGSRMSAMESAVKNCRSLIADKTLEMNKIRQAEITTELIEVVSGAESLKSS